MFAVILVPAILAALHPALIAVISVAGLIALLLLIAAMKPNDFTVTRSLKMKTSAARAFEQVNDLHRMNDWNPWLKLDPNVKQTYSGADAGVGAIYEWDGAKSVGAGRQTIVETRPNELVVMRLEFFRPFPGTNEVRFTVVPEGEFVVVSWSMIGKLNFFMKVMGFFMSMDKMCGDSFLEGLNGMKAIVEA